MMHRPIGRRSAQRKSRFWLWYFGVFLALIGIAIGYGQWRESTLEPLTMSVDIRRPGSHHSRLGMLRFYNSRYHPEFQVELSTPTGEDFWEGDQTVRIWRGDPPMIDLVIRDSTGAIVLRESGAVAEANGWTVTGGPGAGETYFEIDRLTEFKASPFRAYTVDLRVTRGAPAAAVASTRFAISTIKAYALLPNVLLTLFLIAFMIVSTPIVWAVRWLLRRRREAAPV